MKVTLNIQSDDMFHQWHNEELWYLKAAQPATSDEDLIPRAYVSVLKRLKDAS